MRVDRPPGLHHRAGASNAHESNGALRSATARQRTQRDFGKGKPRGGRCQTEIARAGEFKSAAVAVSVNYRDHGLGAALRRRHRIGKVCKLPWRHFNELRNVTAGAETFAGRYAAQHHDTDTLVLL